MKPLQQYINEKLEYKKITPFQREYRDREHKFRLWNSEFYITPNDLASKSVTWKDIVNKVKLDDINTAVENIANEIKKHCPFNVNGEKLDFEEAWQFYYNLDFDAKENKQYQDFIDKYEDILDKACDIERKRIAKKYTK